MGKSAAVQDAAAIESNSSAQPVFIGPGDHGPGAVVFQISNRHHVIVYWDRSFFDSDQRQGPEDTRKVLGYRRIVFRTDCFVWVTDGSPSSLAIIADHPLGIGLAAFKYVFPVYNTRSLSETVMPFYLHNDVLQLLVETGWPGFTLLIGAYLAFMVSSFRRIRRMPFYADPQKFFIAAGAYSGLMSISFHSFFDFNLQIPANAIYFVTLLAMIGVCAEQHNS